MTYIYATLGISRHDSGELEAEGGKAVFIPMGMYQSPRFRRA